MLHSHHRPAQGNLKKLQRQTSSQSASLCCNSGRLTAALRRAQMKPRPRWRGRVTGSAPSAPLNKDAEVLDHDADPAPLWHCQESYRYRKLRGKRAVFIRGSVPLLRHAAQSEPGELLPLRTQSRAVPPSLPAADTLWCCQWCNAELKGDESGFYCQKQNKHRSYTITSDDSWVTAPNSLKLLRL